MKAPRHRDDGDNHSFAGSSEEALFGKYDITNAIIGDRGLIEKVNVEMVALGLLLRNSRCDEISKVQDRGGNYMEKSPTLATKLQAYVYQLDNLAEI
jgi:hypothetical protein